MKYSGLSGGKSRAFSMIETMAATAILTIILLLIFSISSQTGEAWKKSAAKIESFQGARAAFESMTRRISQATLNTYYDYFSLAGDRRTTANAASFRPGKYGRYSDLHFITGKDLLNGGSSPQQITHSIFFQAPLAYTDDPDLEGMNATLNATGYYIEYGPDNFRPAFLQTQQKNRFRLMQFSQPTQELAVYDPVTTSANPKKWFLGPMEKSSDLRPVWQLAENIVAMVILPKRSARDAAISGDLTADFEYDSRTTDRWLSKQPVMQNQLPPLVEVVMVAVDEPSFARFGNRATPPALGQTWLFKETSKLSANLDDVEHILNAKPGNSAGNDIKLRYQIFRSEIPIRSSKWSE